MANAIKILAARRLLAELGDAEKSIDSGKKQQILEWRSQIAEMKTHLESATDTRKEQIKTDIKRLENLIAQKG